MTRFAFSEVNVHLIVITNDNKSNTLKKCQMFIYLCSKNGKICTEKINNKKCSLKMSLLIKEKN